MLTGNSYATAHAHRKLDVAAARTVTDAARSADLRQLIVLGVINAELGRPRRALLTDETGDVANRCFHPQFHGAAVRACAPRAAGATLEVALHAHDLLREQR